jgi:hypothetical protein
VGINVLKVSNFFFDGKLATVFSASNYHGTFENKSGVLLVHENE